MLLSLLGLAQAGDLCRWPKADKPVTTAEGDEVTVNGMAFEVSGEDGRDRFLAVLRLCGAASASDEFEKWREARADLSVALVGAALGGFAAAAGLEDVRKRERAAALAFRNALWLVLNPIEDEVE